MGIETKSLIRATSSGVFCLENSAKKRVYINFSKNMLGYVSRVFEELQSNRFPLKDMVRDLDNLEFKILESRDDIETMDYWIEHYQSQGWTVYNANSKRPLPRTPRVIIADLNKSLVEARLYNRRGDYEVVGVFNNVPEANSFMESCYGDNNPHKLRVFAANFLTRKELSK